MKNRSSQKLSALAGAALLAAIVFSETSSPAEIAKPTVDPAIYGRVVHVGWVVKNLDPVVDYWEKLGLKNIRRAGVEELSDITYLDKKVTLKVKTAWGQIGGVSVEWFQPVEGHSDYDDFLGQHGDGIHHLAFAMTTPEQLDEQVNYFKGLGVDVVQHGTWKGTKGTGRFVYLDTRPRGGGITFELVYDPDATPAGAEKAAANDDPFNKITQYAILVRNWKKVAAYYEGLGFGGTAVHHNISLNRNYRGQPGQFEMYLGFWNWGDVAFEWIETIKGPSVYDEFLKAHGEGFHHLGFNVTDIDKAVETLKAKGAPPAQTGGWGGSSPGRFAYLDTDPHGGVTIELLWSEPRGQ